MSAAQRPSKILIILKEVIIRPFFKDHCRIIIFRNKQALQRTTFSCKSTKKESCWLSSVYFRIYFTSSVYFRIFRSPFVPYQLGVNCCSTETEWAKLLSYQLSILLVTGDSRCLDAEVLSPGQVLGPSVGRPTVDRILYVLWSLSEKYLIRKALTSLKSLWPIAFLLNFMGNNWVSQSVRSISQTFVHTAICRRIAMLTRIPKTSLEHLLPPANV